MALSIEKRWELVFLCRHKLGPQFGYDKAAKYIGCSSTTAKRWVTRYEETGDVLDEPGRGRTRVTTSQEDTKIESVVSKKRTISSREIASELENKGISISERTVRRRLNEMGFKYQNPIVKPLLKETARLSRLKWANENYKVDFSNIIFSDETTVELYRNIKKVWRRKGEQIIYRKVKHPIKVHAWGCFSSQGFGKLYCFANNLNGDLLCKIYEKALLPSASNMFGTENNEWLLQEDNDPKHKSKKAQQFRNENGVKKILWPSYSPDLNPIENVWSVLKSNISQYRVTTQRGLVSAMKKEWKKLNPEYATKLVESMKRRTEAVIQNNGDYTLY